MAIVNLTKKSWGGERRLLPSLGVGSSVNWAVGIPASSPCRQHCSGTGLLSSSVG